MNCKLFGLFSGTHLTVITCAAILVPGALYGAANFSNVAITDAGSGVTAIVDSKQRLHIVDNVAALTNNPSLVVNLSEIGSPSSGARTLYNVPDGQALLIKSITLSYFNSIEGASNFYNVIDSLGNIIYTLEGSRVAESVAINFPAPLIARAGSLVTNYGGGTNSGFRAFIQGYLVPATAVPATSVAGESPQIVSKAGHVNLPHSQ